jgi:hypothetical protein
MIHEEDEREQESKGDEVDESGMIEAVKKYERKDQRKWMTDKRIQCIVPHPW